MKLSVLFTAAALALGGTAYAQQPQPQNNESLGQKADRVFDRAENATSRAVNGAPGEPTLGQKADNVFDRMEAGTKRLWNRVTGNTAQTPSQPVYTDEAYRNAQSQPQR